MRLAILFFFLLTLSSAFAWENCYSCHASGNQWYDSYSVCPRYEHWRHHRTWFEHHRDHWNRGTNWHYEHHEHREFHHEGHHGGHHH